MKKIYLISLSLFLIWGCGGDGGGESTTAPTAALSPSISWNMSSSATAEENTNGATLIDVTLNNSSAQLSISLTGTDASNFSVSNGYLVFTDLPDFENPTDSNTDNSYSLTLNAAGAGISSTHSFDISVTNVNEKPTFTTENTSAFSIDENTTALKTIVASDPENDTVSFSLQDSSEAEDEGLLEIDASTGSITFKVAPNFEKPTDIDLNNSLTFTVLASDGSLSASKKYFASINNVQEAPTNITISNNSILENVAGPEVGTVTIEDEDLDIKTIRVSNSDGGCFTLGPNLVLSVCSTLGYDYEAKSSYSVEITVEDSGGLVFSDTISLIITDVNEAPSSITLANGTGAENSAGVSFGTLDTIDPDNSDTFTYAVTGGADEASFEIGSSNQLKFKSTVSANFETKSSYTVTVTSTDSASNTVSKSLTVSITDVNESPTDISLSTGVGNASENEAGASFGTLSTSDPDASDTFSYAVTGGADSASFEIGSSNQIKFKSSVSGNYEVKNSFEVTVTATDAGSNTYSKTFYMYLTDVNEFPSFTSTSVTSVAENGTAILTVTSSDPEGAALTFSLGAGDDTAKFNITSAGVLTFLRSPDYEIPGDSDEDNVYRVNIIVSDGIRSTGQAMDITVTDVTEAAALETPENVQTVETK